MKLDFWPSTPHTIPHWRWSQWELQRPIDGRKELPIPYLIHGQIEIAPRRTPEKPRGTGSREREPDINNLLAFFEKRIIVPANTQGPLWLTGQFRSEGPLHLQKWHPAGRNYENFYFKEMSPWQTEL